MSDEQIRERTPEDIPILVDDDIIARQLREAALAEEDPVLRQAFDRGRETERHTLHNVLYRAATELGNTTAAMFLLKARHGYREGDQGEQANRVQITFTLPGAMQPEQFTIQANDRSTENQPVSRAVLERS